MMKHFHFSYLVSALILLVCFTEDLSAQQTKKLCFNADSTFKIVQFTDLHLVWNDKRSDAAYQCIDHVIKSEKPDFIIITGDIIYSNPATDNFKKIMNYVSSYKIPFGFVFGNHDRQFNVTDSVLLNSVKNVPYNLTTTTKGVSGDSNYTIPLYSQDGKQVESVIYCFDSHANSQLDGQGIKGYDYIHRDQINWYVNISKQYTAENTNQPLPSIAFMHIPIPEYAEAITNQTAQLYGIRREPVCCPALNSGLFTAIKEQGDIMGIFCGHDHDNDYAVNWYNTLLAYGRFSGGNTEYNHLDGNGARIIVLKENAYTIHTWIRLARGTIEQNTTFPKDYISK